MIPTSFYEAHTLPGWVSTWNSESSDLAVWQNQAQVILTKALECTPLGLGKFMNLYLSNRQQWPELTSGFVLKCLNVIWSLDPTLFPARPVVFSNNKISLIGMWLPSLFELPQFYLSLLSGTSVFLYEWLLLVSLCCTHVSVLHHSLVCLIYTLSCADLCCRVKRPRNLGPSCCLIYFAVCCTASGSLFPGDLLLGNYALFF